MTSLTKQKTNGVQIKNVSGLLFIGDPHLESRQHGFRKDDFPQVALKKLAWCLEYAKAENLQPFLLGDLFQFPRENPNWLLSEIIELLDEPLPAIYGNHDVRENSVKNDDSIQILFGSGRLRQVTQTDPWRGSVDGNSVCVTGVSWGQDRYLKELAAPDGGADLAICMTHHDILIPGYEEGGTIKPREVIGLDLVMNGHIHRRLDRVSKGSTHWITAGNILRQKRSELTRSHVPAVVCVVPAKNTSQPIVEQAPAIDSTTVNPATGKSAMGKSASRDAKPSPSAAVAPTPVAPEILSQIEAGGACIHAFDWVGRNDVDWQCRWVSVPHQPFDVVFHSHVEVADEVENEGSDFIADLRELIERKTDSGAGLSEYLANNLTQFEPQVADEILRLKDEVTANLTAKN